MKLNQLFSQTIQLSHSENNRNIFQIYFSYLLILNSLPIELQY